MQIQTRRSIGFVLLIPP
ncbi:hypothetical protein V3C99_013890 [Haemonchus contortus]